MKENSLVYFSPKNFSNLESKPDVKIWQGVLNLFGSGVCFIDRTNTIKSPIRSTSATHIKLPKLDNKFNLSFDSCAIATAQEIYDKCQKHNVKIRLYWSGGIDSSVILMAFIELLGISKTVQCVDIVMTQKSIAENPFIWEKIVRKEKFNLIHATEFTEKWDGSEIIVTGEGGDQIHGSDLYRLLTLRYGKTSLLDQWTDDLIIETVQWKTGRFKMERALDDAAAEKLASVLINQVQNAPIKIETHADFWWWINFTCKWSAVYYRLVSKALICGLDKYNLNEYYFPFYTNNIFQQWAMTSRHEAHQGTWESYKWKAKKFLVESTGCKELELKHRQPSLFQILSHTTQHEAIDENFNFYSSIDLADWYNEDNSFV